MIAVACSCEGHDSFYGEVVVMTLACSKSRVAKCVSLALPVLAAMILTDAAWAGAEGSEFRVNTFTTRGQDVPSVGMDSSGNFVIAWYSDGQDGDGWGVYAQRFNALGVAQGGEIQVNTETTASQWLPSVGMDGSGNFVIVWTSDGQDGDGLGVYAQRYNASGVAQGGEFQVNTETASTQWDSSVGMDGSGNFVIAWTSYLQDGDSSGVYAQRYNASGVAQGGEFLVNTVTTGWQSDPSVGMDSSGNFLIAWRSDGQDGDNTGVFAQRYDASGVAQGSEFQVNTETSGAQHPPSVGMDAFGNFVIAWASDAQDGSGLGVYAQRYDASGVAQGGEFQVNTETTDFQSEPSVDMDASGNFVIAWHSIGQDGDGAGVYAQRYDASGVAQGGEFLVNTETTDFQSEPSVSMASTGDIVIAWESAGGQDGSSHGVYAQRYEFPSPPTCGTITPTTPLSQSSVRFVVSFSKDVQNFNAASDLVIVETGTVTHTGVSIAAFPDVQTYIVDVTGVFGTGTISLAVSTLSDVQDLDANPLFSSVTSPEVAIDLEPPHTGSGLYETGQTVELMVAGPFVPGSAVWRDHNGDIIPGETGSTLTLTNVMPGESGTYTVTYDNGTSSGVVAEFEINIFDQLPVGGAIGLGLLAGLLALSGVGLRRGGRHS